MQEICRAVFIDVWRTVEDHLFLLSIYHLTILFLPSFLFLLLRHRLSFSIPCLYAFVYTTFPRRFFPGFCFLYFIFLFLFSPSCNLVLLKNSSSPHTHIFTLLIYSYVSKFSFELFSLSVLENICHSNSRKLFY